MSQVTLEQNIRSNLNKVLIWKTLLIIGICPFILPYILGIYRMSIESWIMIDWLVLYSFIYWPMYVVGIVLIIVSLKKLKLKIRQSVMQSMDFAWKR